MGTANEKLGARIKEQRRKRGLTQDELAGAIGIDQKHMSRIELGKSYPSIDRLIGIAKTLNVPLPSLFEFEHLSDEPERIEKLNEMIGRLNEVDRRRIFLIVKAFLETTYYKE